MKLSEARNQKGLTQEQIKSGIEHWPEWIKPALDERFLERAREASNLEELGELYRRQQEMITHLKQQLTSGQFEIILEWEEMINHRCTTEKEWLYFAGLKDGLCIWKHLLNSVSD